MNHPTLPAIDCHSHVISYERPILSHRHAQPIRNHLPDELLAEFDRCGVVNGRLSAPSFYLADNSLPLETLKAYPRLKGTAKLAPDTSLAQLYAFNEQGICGTRLNLYRSAVRQDTSPCRNFL